jgi:selenocysteine-specific elongation factor
MSCIGTAGHVDHGKSTLVTALTGMDPDRLAEEKARGMTIDLGFAWLTLPSGREVSIVDVPGHESFIKNMLAGVGGIDVALLVVAADEGVMPQTREHLAILDLLEVSAGVVALTKCDLVDDPEWLELVQEDIREQLKPTTLHDAVIVACSAVTGMGLPQLVEALDHELASHPGRSDKGSPRLPVDRVFTVTGFGTVVTGTLQDGKLRVGQEVQIYPTSQRTRIRSLQAHKQSVEEGYPGGRLAANLVGVAKTDIVRGQVLALPGTLRPTTALDVRLQVISGAERPLTHNTSLALYAGSAEVPARILLLHAGQLQPGQSGWAQLRLKRPLALLRGDRFILRIPSPSETIGGGVVVDPWARRHRRYDLDVLQRLEQLSQSDPEQVVLAALRPEHKRSGPSKKKQARQSKDVVKPSFGNYYGRDIQDITGTTGIPESNTQEALEALAGRGEVVRAGSYAFVAGEWDRLSTDAVQLVAAYHHRYPLRAGMPREEWRSRLGLSAKAAVETLAALVRSGSLAEETAQASDTIVGTGGAPVASGGGTRGVFVKLPRHEPHMTEQEAEGAAAMLERFHDDPYAPPTWQEVDDSLGSELAQVLLDQGKLVRVSDAIVLDRVAYTGAITQVVGYLQEHKTITVAQARDLLGTSRKYMLAILEHFDQLHITKRQGDDRILGPRAAAALGPGASQSAPDTTSGGSDDTTGDDGVSSP